MPTRREKDSRKKALAEAQEIMEFPFVKEVRIVKGKRRGTVPKQPGLKRDLYDVYYTGKIHLVR
jgi:hypothetical protein